MVFAPQHALAASHTRSNSCLEQTPRPGRQLRRSDRPGVQWQRVSGFLWCLPLHSVRLVTLLALFPLITRAFIPAMRSISVIHYRVHIRRPRDGESSGPWICYATRNREITLSSINKNVSKSRHTHGPVVQWPCVCLVISILVTIVDLTGIPQTSKSTWNWAQLEGLLWPWRSQKENVATRVKQPRIASS